MCLRDWYFSHLDSGNHQAILDALDEKGIGRRERRAKGWKREMAVAAVGAVVEKYHVNATRRGGGMPDASAGSGCDVVARAFGLGYKTVRGLLEHPS